MNPKELIDKFIKFEYENDLFNKEIEGIKYWHYVRFGIYNEILKQKYKIGQAHSKSKENNIFEKIWDKFLKIPDYIIRNPIYGLKQKDILILNHKRRIKNFQHYDCKYTEEILEKLNKTFYVFETSYLGKHFKPVRTKNLKYFDYLNITFEVKKN